MKKTWKNKLLKALRTPPEQGGPLQTSDQLWGRYTAPDTPDDPATSDELTWERTKADSFCCLGVMTNILVDAGHMSWDAPVPNDDNIAAYTSTIKEAVDRYSVKRDAVFPLQDAVKQGWLDAAAAAYQQRQGYKYVALQATYAESGMPGVDFYKITGMNKKQAEKLAGMNDNGDTFDEIAAFIDSPHFERIS